MLDRCTAARVPLTTVGRMAGVVCAVLVLGPCGSRDVAGQPSAPAEVPVSTPRPSAPLPGEGAGRGAVAAYREMWQAFARAAMTSDPLSPGLDDFATGPALTSIKRSLYADFLGGVVTRGEPVVAPVVRSAEPAADPRTVLIEDCGDSSHSLKFHAGTNRPAGDGTGRGRRAIRAEVMRQPDGSWKVTRFAVRAVGSC